MLAVCAVETAAMVAVKAALRERRGTLRVDGTWTAMLLLVSRTDRFGTVKREAPSLTVHASVPAPAMADSVQERLSRLAGSAVAIPNPAIRT